MIESTRTYLYKRKNKETKTTTKERKMTHTLDDLIKLLPPDGEWMCYKSRLFGENRYVAKWTGIIGEDSISLTGRGTTPQAAMLELVLSLRGLVESKLVSLKNLQLSGAPLRKSSWHKRWLKL